MCTYKVPYLTNSSILAQALLLELHGLLDEPPVVPLHLHTWQVLYQSLVLEHLNCGCTIDAPSQSNLGIHIYVDLNKMNLHKQEQSIKNSSTSVPDIGFSGKLTISKSIF